MRRVVLFLALIICIITTKAVAQNSANYTFSNGNTEALTDMSSGTIQLVGPGLDAANSPVTDFGFTFVLMGNAFTQFSVQDDGLMQLGSTQVGTNVYSIAAGTASAPRLAAFNADFRTGTSTGKIHYKVTGTAPNRVLTVEFKDMQLFYLTTAGAGTSTFQIRLYETSGIIEYVYGAMNATSITSGNRSPSIGFYTGSATGAFASILYASNSVSTTTPYAANPAVAAIGDIANLNSTANGSRVYYRFTPPAPPSAPTTLSFANIGLSKMDLNWVDNSSDELGFAILRSTDNINFSVLGSVAAGVTTFTGTGLTASTTYYWQVVSFSEGRASSPLAATQATLAAVPLSGIYTINNTQPTLGTNFNNFTDAFNKVNDNGIGGPVAFNVFAGQTFNEILPPLTATGTSANAITFKRFGTGANPVVQRTDAGTLTTSTFGGQGDAVITIQGGDYITFDSIDVSATDAGIEYGYLLRKANATNGCKFIAIKNANVTMTRPSTGTPYVTGIYSSNLDATSLVSSATGVTVTSTGGRHENVTITGNTISNVFYGINLRGFAHASAPYNFYDSAFTVGASGTGNGNTINNFGGFSTSVNYGIYVQQHKSASVMYNTLNNTDNGGVASTGTIYGIYISTNTTSDFTASRNNININSAYASGSIYGIYNSASTGNFIADYNTISLNNTAATSGTISFIYNGSATAATNVSISNNILTNSTFNCTGTVYVIYNSVTNAALTTINSNEISNFTKSGSAVQYSYYNLATPTGTEIFSGNNIFNISSAGTASLYGYYSSTGTAHRHNVFNNSIYTLSGGGTLYAIYKGGGVGNIYKNKIYDLATSATGSQVVGVYLTSGSKDSIYNNVIGDLKATAYSGVNGVIGIYSASTSATSTIGVYYNTIELNATSSGTNFGTSGLYLSGSATSTSANAEVKNNIIVNNSTASGTGKTVVYRRSSTSLLNFASTSNNNLLYSSTGSIFYDGTAEDATLAAYKTRVSPRETASVSETPNYVSTLGSDPTYLHINTTIATQIESGGSPVTGITDDFDGNTRNASTPDMGADEFTGVGADFTPPSITFTNLASACANGDRTLSNVVIQDGSGVPTTGTLVPRIYYRKGNGTWFSQPGTLSSGTATNGVWSFNIIAADMGGVAFGNVISYYVIAQDIASPINIASNAAGVTATNVNTVSAAPAAPASYPVGLSLSGNYNIGATGTFTTLTDAVAVYNGCPLAGPTTFTLVDPSYGSEIYPIIIDSNSTSSLTNTLTIKPSSTTAVILSGTSGTSPAALIQLRNADYITIDGINNGGASLSLENTSTTAGSGVVWLSSLGVGRGATNNNIRNLNIKGGITQNTSTDATYGIVIAGNVLNSAIASLNGGDDNDNNIIEGNTFSTLRYGIYTRGASTTNPNLGTTIRKNIIGPAGFGTEEIGKAGIVIREEDGIKVDSNEIRFVGGDYANTSVGGDRTGIALTTDASWPAPTSVYIKNANITRNIIHHIVEERTFASSAIVVAGADGTNATNNIIANNIIYNILANGTGADQLAAIGINAGKGDKVVYNSISLVGDTDPTAAATASATSGFGITIGTTTPTDLILKNNNVVINLTSSSATALKFAAINIPAAYAWGAGGMNYNNWYNEPSNTQAYLGCVGGSGGTFQTALAAWQTATTQDANSKSIDPLFISPTDLHVSSSSPMDNAATPIAGVTIDIDGQIRSSVIPDIGADEVNVSNCSGAIGGSIVANSTNFCAGDSSLITATGFSIGTGSTYQWESSLNNLAFNPVASATNPSSINTSALNATTYFRLKVTCTAGTATAYSNVVTITIKPAPSISTTPTGNVPLCAPATQLINTSTSAASASYIWYNDGTEITGAAGNSYTVLVTGSYKVKVTDGATSCNSTSAAVNVTINPIPSALSVTPTSVVSCNTSTTAKLLTATGGSLSGVLLLNENFNGAATGWTTVNNTTTTGTGNVALTAWTLTPNGFQNTGGTTVYTFNSNDNSQFYLTNADPGKNGVTVSTILQSPSFNTSGFTTLNLSFYQHYKYATASSGKVEVSTNGTSWTQLYTTGNTADIGTSTGFVLQTINLDAYVNYPTVFVRFKFDGAWDWFWAIDNVAVSGSAPTNITWAPTAGLFTDANATIPYTGTVTSSVFAKPAATTTYTITAKSAADCSVTSSVTVTNDCSVPVSLLNFRGERQGNNNLLSWTTVTELNNAGFELQRSADGVNFSKLAFVESKAFNGNSNGNLNYSLTDTKSLISGSYYRLKQIDKDGKSTLSPIVFIKGVKVSKLELVSVYPNPTVNTLNISLVSPKADNVTFVVSDITGKVIIRQTASVVNGDNNINVNVSTLAKGTYTIKAICNDGCETAISKFVKQ